MVEFTITSDQFPVLAKQMALKLIEAPVPFIAREAIYTQNIDAISDFVRFPLIIEGKFSGENCTVKISGINYIIATDILILFGFEEARWFQPSKTSFVKTFYRHDSRL